MDKGGGGRGVELEEEEERECIEVVGGGVLGEVDERVEDASAGDGSVGIDDVELVMDEGGEELDVELCLVGDRIEGAGGIAALPEAFEVGAAMSGGGARNGAGDGAAEDMVSA